MIGINKIGNILPLGYLFIVLMGIIKETLFFNQIGIDILNYSSITDILLSPISNLTTNWMLLLILIIIAFSLYYVMTHLFKKRDTKWVQKYIFKNVKREFWKKPEKEIKPYFFNFYLIYLSLFFLGVYVQAGFSEGREVSTNLKNNNLKYKYSLSYLYSSEEVEVSLIASNSINYFYVIKGETNIRISPTTAIKSLKKIQTNNPKNKAVNKKIGKSGRNVFD